ncbi:YqaJ viral recombinase family protein [Cupriavidus gilardii]|uniref:YqaJ viral recombinase family protein n=1 Tax=Cupriavidus gilardii TaxID=82541 RepID=A0ABY4VQJ3_9BURK|nr:lambda exonuclease family protein [Cupriavidus gilardii]USE79524.1 YqaJ viral recombinase family protein [Cupriavidus gilardii]
MIIHRAPQGSPEWHAARAGCITASNFKLARQRLKTGPNKGDYTEAAKDYAFRVAIERISGTALDEGFETWQMKRGHELEPEARRAHEAMTGALVEEVGFVTTEDRLFGASADGFIDDDGGAEYKCFIAPDKLRSILLSGDTTDVIDQCDGGMWITGRTYWDFCLYCPALEPIGRALTVHRIQRDDNRIEALEKDLMQFAALVADFERVLRQKVA